MSIGDIGEFTTLSLGINAADPADRAKLFFRAKNSLSTDGSLTIDHNNLNDGTLNPDLATGQSPGLVFGAPNGASSGEGIASKRSDTGNQNGLDFYTNSVVRLSITNAGNVGIGTSSLPVEKLEVDGIVKATDFLQADGSNLSSKVSKAGDTITGALTIQGALSTTGNVGIGTTNPSRRLTVQGEGSTFLNVRANNGTHEVLLGADNNGGILSTMTNHDLQLRAGTNSTKVTIKADGKVGIGTLAPTEKLHVGGAVRATEFIGSGSSLTGVLKGGTVISRTFTLTANAEVPFVFLRDHTENERFYIASVVPIGINASVSWFSVATRDSTSVRYALVIKNLGPQTIQAQCVVRLVNF